MVFPSTTLPEGLDSLSMSFSDMRHSKSEPTGLPLCICELKDYGGVGVHVLVYVATIDSNLFTSL